MIYILVVLFIFVGALRRLVTGHTRRLLGDPAAGIPYGVNDELRDVLAVLIRDVKARFIGSEMELVGGKVLWKARRMKFHD